MQKKYLIFLAVPVIALAVAGGAEAFFGGPQKTDLVNSIAQKFNLNSSEVQQVFDSHHSQMQAQMEENFKQRLSTLVSNGSLTQEQADKIIAKRAEINSQLQGLQGKTGEEFAAEKKEIMDSLKQWADENNVPANYLMMGGRGAGGRGFGRMGGLGNNIDCLLAQ